MEGDFDSGPPLRQYDSRPLAGPPIVPLLLTVGPADRQVQSTRRPGPILESASLFLPLAALRRIPRKRLACSATGGAAPLSPILDFTPTERQRKEKRKPIRFAPRITECVSSRANYLKLPQTWARAQRGDRTANIRHSPAKTPVFAQTCRQAGFGHQALFFSTGRGAFSF